MFKKHLLSIYLRSLNITAACSVRSSNRCLQDTDYVPSPETDPRERGDMHRGMNEAEAQVTAQIHAPCLILTLAFGFAQIQLTLCLPLVCIVLLADTCLTPKPISWRFGVIWGHTQGSGTFGSPD